MKIHWRSEKFKKELENKALLLSTYDKKMARNISRRLIELEEAENYAKVPTYSGKHSIKEGKKFLYFAVDLPGRSEKRGKNRLLFRPYGDYDLSNSSTIKEIEILQIKNYH